MKITSGMHKQINSWLEERLIFLRIQATQHRELENVPRQLIIVVIAAGSAEGLLAAGSAEGLCILRFRQSCAYYFLFSKN